MKNILRKIKNVENTIFLLRRCIILSIILCSIVFSITAASAADKTYYWTPSSGVIGSSGFTANWGGCNAQPTSYRITTLNSTGFTCNNDRLTRTSSGDQFLAIYPGVYSSNTQIKGKTGATFYLSSQKNGYTATYRFDLGYARNSTFTSFGNVTTAVQSRTGQNYIINLSSITGIAPANSSLTLKVSVTTSQGGRVYLGTNGGSTGSNSGRFYVNETVVSASTYNVSTSALPNSSSINAGNSYLYNISVNNTGNSNGNYTLSAADSDAVNFTNSTIGITTMQINSGGSATTTLNVTAKAGATTGARDNVAVTVRSVENPIYTNSTNVNATVVAVTTGGPDCKACHNIGGSAPKLINFSIANNSGHKNLNSGASSTVGVDNKKCWACHGDGTQPSGHPSNYKTPVPCENCHTGTGGYSAPLVKEHIQNGDEVKTTAICMICHNNSGMFLTGGIGNVTHYIKNITDITTTPYGHFGTIDSTNCLICHNGQYTGNTSWDRPVDITTSLKRQHTETTNVQCDLCHKDNNVSTLANVDFHNSSVKNVGGPNCIECHANAE